MPKKLVVILGPTASGKSELAIKLAKKFNGEIVSADSRQVYKSLDIGTGKVTPDTKNSSNFSTGQAKKKYIFTHKGIPHYCIDVASPKRRFTVAQYRKLALKAINKIFKKGKVPIFCGGTGFYIQAVVDGIIIPEVKPDWRLRSNLNKFPVEELYKILKKLDPRRAKTIEKKNPRRLIRAIEIVIKTKKPVPPFKKTTSSLSCFNDWDKEIARRTQKINKKEVFKMVKARISQRDKKFKPIRPFLEKN